LNDDYVEALKELEFRNPQKWQIYGLGHWGVITDALVYHNWAEQDFEPNNALELMCGLDWGYVNDPTAFICSLLDEENKTIYIFKEWYAKGQTNPQIANALKEMGFAKSTIICDSAE